jgi:hypothetical protein
MTKPTQWYLYEGADGDITHAARSHWPGSTLVELWSLGRPAWTAIPILDQLGEDPDWEESTEDAVNAWIAAQSA